MQKNISARGTIILACSIVLAIFFYTFFYFDYLDIETKMIGVIRGVLIIPFFLAQIVLPVIIFTTLHKENSRNRKHLLYAGAISLITIGFIFINTFIF